MDTNYNKVLLIGRLATAPKGNFQKDEKRAFVSVRLAVTRHYTSAKGTVMTDYFLIKTWGSLAERILKIGTKNMSVLVSGELQTETYNGETITYVKASDFYDLTSSTPEPQPVPEQQATPEPSSQVSETVTPASERTATHAENGFSQEQPLNQQGLAPAQNKTQQPPFETTPKVTVTQIDPVAQTATAFYQKDGSRQTRHMSVSKLLVLQSQLDHSQDGTVELTEQQFESDQM